MIAIERSIGEGGCLDAPLILNSYRKLAVMENEDIRTECLVDGYPKPEIKWTGPSGGILDSFTEERALNNTVRVSILHCKFLFVFSCFSKFV